MNNSEYQKIRSFMKNPLFSPEGLTERQYEMARMYFVEQHTMDEIADILGVNQSTVSRLIRVAAGKYLRYITPDTKNSMLHMHSEFHENRLS